MSTKNDLIREVRMLTRHYIVKGGKSNRLQQQKRMLDFAYFCRDELKAHNLDSIGKRHVICYYKSIFHLSDATRQAHYYALKTLFALAGKASPPVPFKRLNTLNNKQSSKRPAIPSGSSQSSRPIVSTYF